MEYIGDLSEAGVSVVTGHDAVLTLISSSCHQSFITDNTIIHVVVFPGME